MRSNLYHLLHFIPATEAWEMPPMLEALAQQFVQSGKLRINADHERNFVRHGTADTDQTFTARELTDPVLAPRTHAMLARHVAPAAGDQGMAELRERLLADLKKARGVSTEKEMKVARVLVQSAHPSVIQSLLQSGTEIFVSYAHNVGDLMPVRDWETHGVHSGMQATEERGTAVYISCAGDPFFEGEHKTYTTDGFPALARMVVIAGQEFGHFADLLRNRSGQMIGRHSLDIAHTQMRANPVLREGRISDMQQVAQLTAFYQRAGLPLLRNAERGVAFYHQRYRFTPPWLYYQLLRLVAWSMLVIRSGTMHQRLKTYPYHRHGDALELYLADMAFNLAPDAEVYRNPDPLIEEAIACIEAIARVPQQVHKWGHAAVLQAWPQLYRFYYGQIIPQLKPVLVDNTSLFQKVIIKLRRHLRQRPGYYPD